MQGSVEVRFRTPATRAFLASAWLAAAGFFAWLAWTQHSPGHEIGYGMAFGLAWLTLYFLRTPSVLVTADSDGFTYVERSLGWLMVFREMRAHWSDVLAVDTRRHVTKGGSYLRSRITLRGEGGEDARHFSLTNRSPGYADFLAALRERTVEGAVEQRGLGADPLAAEGAGRPGARRSTAALAMAIGLAALGLVVAIVSAVARRH